MTKYCCHDFDAATERYTDSEGYGALLYKIDDDWRIGFGLSRIEFCPWCGKPIQYESKLP